MNGNAIIVIEGPDGIGKTTAAGIAKEVSGFGYKHCSAPEDYISAKKEYFELLESDVPLVLDRSWLGEGVYAPLLRGYEFDYLRELEAVMREKEMRVLYILLATRERPYVSSGDGFLDKMFPEIMARFVGEFNKIRYGEKIILNNGNILFEKDKKAIIRRITSRWLDDVPMNPEMPGRSIFQLMAPKYVYPFLVNDYSWTFFNDGWRFINGEMGIPVNCEKCQFFKSHSQYDYYRDHQSITWGVGNLDAEIVFVGEAPGWQGCGRLGIPFYNDRSGMLFREAMFWSGISETEVYITNAVKCNPPGNKIGEGDVLACLELLEKELSHLKNKKTVVAVGRVAHDCLEKIGISHVRVLHPAFALYKPLPEGYPAYFRNKMETFTSGGSIFAH